MTDEQNVTKEIVEVSQDDLNRIVYAIDGVSESIEKLNSALAEQLRHIKLELDCMNSM